MLDETGVRWGVAGGTLFVGAAVCAVVPLSGGTGVLALLVLTMAWCRVLPRAYGVALAVAGWAFATGFAMNRYGELTFTPGDLARLLLYVGVAALVARAQCPP